VRGVNFKITAIIEIHKEVCRSEGQTAQPSTVIAGQVMMKKLKKN
jgi:hypothetical protein